MSDGVNLLCIAWTVQDKGSTFKLNQYYGDLDTKKHVHCHAQQEDIPM